MKQKVELCGKPMPKAKNGADRGFCTRIGSDGGGCGNGTCSGCAIKFTRQNTKPSAYKRGTGNCRNCTNRYQRIINGTLPRKFATPEKFHTFPCGCSGILPLRGESNVFSISTGIKARKQFQCRISNILHTSRAAARRRGYEPIDSKTPHGMIRTMMAESSCWRCKKPLIWVLGIRSTPHLHHDHETGEIYGFTHPRCNPKALEHEIDELKKELIEIKKEFTRCEHCGTYNYAGGIECRECGASLVVRSTAHPSCISNAADSAQEVNYESQTV